MGDMADMALDDCMDFEDLRTEYHCGNMSVLDAFDAGIVDELGYEYAPAGNQLSRQAHPPTNQVRRKPKS